MRCNIVSCLAVLPRTPYSFFNKCTKNLGKRKPLYFPFGDLEKAFDRLPRKVIWWVMQKLSIEEWKIRFVQAIHANAASSVRMNNTCSEKFVVKVGIHQGSVLSPLLFVTVMEALSWDCRTYGNYYMQMIWL